MVAPSDTIETTVTTRDKALVTKQVFSRDEHEISRSDIDPDALKIIHRLNSNGFKCYVVGGGVRDLLLGKAPKDFDIATDATPNRMKALFRNCRIIGKRFKLAHIYFQGNKIIEVATFRDATDPSETDEDSGSLQSRDNRYGTESTDAIRRDITINGLFYDAATQTIVDYVGGMADLRAGIVRVIGDPEERFREDPVRMMRVVRHAARSGFSIEQGCWDAISANKEEILKCSQVRVFEELKKDLSSGFWLEISSLLAQTSLIELLLPELCEDNFALLSPKSGCAHGFERLDQLVRDGERVGPIAIFSLIALYNGAPFTPASELPDRFPDDDDLREHLKDCFLGLSVPRKDRERIESLLLLWLRLATTPRDKVKRNALLKNPMIHDLRHLVGMLYETDDEYSLAPLLPGIDEVPDESADDDSAPRGEGRRGGGRRRRRRPRAS